MSPCRVEQDWAKVTNYLLGTGHGILHLCILVASVKMMVLEHLPSKKISSLLPSFPPLPMDLNQLDYEKRGHFVVIAQLRVLGLRGRSIFVWAAVIRKLGFVGFFRPVANQPISDCTSHFVFHGILTINLIHLPEWPGPILVLCVNSVIQSPLCDSNHVLWSSMSKCRQWKQALLFLQIYFVSFKTADVCEIIYNLYIVSP